MTAPREIRKYEPSAPGVAWALVRMAVVTVAYWIGRLAERLTDAILTAKAREEK